MISRDIYRPVTDVRSIRSHRQSATILLVDDDPGVLAVLKVMLNREGYNVIAVGSPLSALEIASRQNFTMLVTDFQMPAMDGFSLACRLATTRAALPVLLISGSDPSDLPMVQIAERNWTFAPKPINRERVLRMIDGECLGWAVRLSA